MLNRKVLISKFKISQVVATYDVLPLWRVLCGKELLSHRISFHLKKFFASIRAFDGAPKRTTEKECNAEDRC